MITPEEIKTTLERRFPGAVVETRDLTGGGDHWQVIVVTDAFEGKALLEQHRLVNEALQAEIGDQRIHALALKTFTPAQWGKFGS